jgi:hypothetical protein
MVLAAFPARIRRRHGSELITTLAEMTDGRPSRTDRLRLVADGLRERFRLPARRPLNVLTVAAARDCQYAGNVYAQRGQLHWFSCQPYGSGWVMYRG